MANKWFKFYGGEYLSDPKIENLTGNERSCWITLLSLASTSSNENGVIEFLTTEILLKKSGIEYNPYNTEEWDLCLGVLNKFERMKMIETTDDGKIFIKNWEKRQEHNLTVAERVAKHRAKKKESNKDVTTNVTSVTTEENRIEENRIYSKSAKADKSNNLSSYKKYLDKIPEEDIKELIKNYHCTRDQVMNESNKMRLWVDGYKKKIPNYKKAFELRIAKKYGVRKKDYLKM